MIHDTSTSLSLNCIATPVSRPLPMWYSGLKYFAPCKNCGLGLIAEGCNKICLYVQSSKWRTAFDWLSIIFKKIQIKTHASIGHHPIYFPSPCSYSSFQSVINPIRHSIYMKSCLNKQTALIDVGGSSQQLNSLSVGRFGSYFLKLWMSLEITSLWFIQS